MVLLRQLSARAIGLRAELAVMAAHANAEVKTKSFIQDALAGIFISYICVININHFDLSWDTLAYHLPFAGLRTGIIGAEQFGLRPWLHYRYLGFPPLADLVQGALWGLFGRPEAVALLSPIAILLLSLYLRVAYRVSMIWTALVFLAVPILHTALNAGYVDLWTNAFFVIHLFSAVKARSPCRNRLLHTAISCAALAISVNSKEQFFVVGTMSFALIALDRIIRLLVAKPTLPFATPEARDLLLLAVLAPIVFFSPLRNLALYGNPIYPVTVKIADHTFPGTESNEWSGPRALARDPAPVRYILSQLDLEAANMRPDGYDLDQDAQPSPGMSGERMGGSLAVLLLMAGTYLVLALRRPLAGRPDALLIGGFGMLVAGISLLPGFNELRYSPFTEITVIVAALYLLTKAGDQGDETASTLALSLKIALVCSAVYVASLTGWQYLKWPVQKRAEDVVRGAGIVDQVRSLVSAHAVICYPRNDKNAFLYSPALNARLIGKSYGFVATDSVSDCPAGSGVVP